MKLPSISSLLVPASAVLLQFALWSSPVARAADSVPAQASSGSELSSAEDPAALLPDTEDGELRASCSSSNRVYVQYCKDPDSGIGICRLRSGCTYSDAAYAECRKDLKTVCGYVPATYVLY